MNSTPATPFLIMLIDGGCLGAADTRSP